MPIYPYKRKHSSIKKQREKYKAGSKTKIVSFADFLAVYSNPIMNIIIGLCLLLVNVGDIANVMFIIVGVFFIIEAAFDLLSIFRSKPKKVKAKSVDDEKK